MFKKKIFKKNVAVHCNTKEKDLALRTYAHSKGYKWNNGDSFLDKFYPSGDDYCILVVNGSWDSSFILKTRNDYKIIPFEKALKKGYEWNEELGKIVFPASEKEEVKEEVKEEIKYPIYARSNDIGNIVKFTSIGTGEVVLLSNESNLSVGYTSTLFVQHNDKEHWQILDYNEERGLYDTQPVLCWSKYSKSHRILSFYDVENDKSFDSCGNRGNEFDNMKTLKKEQLIAFKDEIAEMYKNLKV